MTDPSNGTVLYRIAELEKDVAVMSRKVDRLMWSIVSLAIALTTTSLILLITRLAETSS